MTMAYEGTALSILEGVFAMEEEEIIPLKPESPASSTIHVNYSDPTITTGHHGSRKAEPDLSRDRESISDRRQYRRKARPMPHKEFSLNSMLSLDTPYRQASLDLPARPTTSDELNANSIPNDETKTKPDVDDVKNTNMKNPSQTQSSDNDNTDNLCEFDGLRESESSESQACYGNENVVTKLKSEYVRWFYKCDADRQWTPFTGYDSTRLEAKWKHREKEIRLKAKLDTQSQTATIGEKPSVENQERKFSLVSKSYFQSPTLALEESPVNSATSLTSFTTTKTTYSRRGSKKWFGSWIDDDDSDSDEVTFVDEITQTDSKPEFTEAGADSPKKVNKGTVIKPPTYVVHVRGALYECNLDALTCTATYWPADSFEITRGTWFYDGTWQPLPAEQAIRLEDEHLGKFVGTPLTVTFSPEELEQPDSPTRTRAVLHRVSFPEFHVDWTSPTEIHLYSKAASYQFVRSVGQRLGFQTWGHRLCRGYLKPASLVDRPSEISHIVFVVHGIGQKMDTGRIVRNCATFRECVANMRARYFPQQLGSRQRAEFFPVEWRSSIKLDGDIVDNITPNKLLTLRQLLNSTAMDIMYYTSPLYRGEIQGALMTELNRIYANFVKRNPNFEARGGKISIMAHSLGAVVTYDIITGYCFDVTETWPGGSINVISESTEEINHEGIIIIDDVAGVSVPKKPKGLQFKLEHFFCLGSPLSVFLALRYREPHNPDLRSHILPHHLCKRFYNVFHPSDPVAYRVEPLLNQSYRNIVPLCINTYNALVQAKFEEMSKQAIGREYYYFEKDGENIFGVPIQDAETQEQSSSNAGRLNPFMNIRSPPTNSKDTGRGWWNLIKYWKTPGGQYEQNTEMRVDVVTQTDELPSSSTTTPKRNSPIDQKTQTGEDGPDDTSAETETPNPDPSKIEHDLEYRIDYVLRESNLSNSYLSALTSHTSYWSSPEIAFFILTHLHNGPLDLRQDKAV